MFTKKILKNMKLYSSSKKKNIIYIIFFLVLALVPLFKGITDFIISKQYSNLANKTMSDVFYRLIHGFSPYETYSGVYCVAVKKLGDSLFAFHTTFFLLTLIAIVVIFEKKNSQIRNLTGNNIVYGKKGLND